MKLYREETGQDQSTEMTLLLEHESLSYLKATARHIAMAEGGVEIAWLWGADHDKTEFPHELEANDRWRLVIRSW